MRPDLRSFALLLALTAVCVPVQGQEFTWDVQAGFGNVCRQNAWTTVRVTVENTGASARGRIALRTDGPRPVTYAVPVELPEGSRKTYSLLVPRVASDTPVSLSLHGIERNTKLSNTRCVGDEALFAVVIANNPSVLSFLQGTSLRPSGQPARMSAGRVTSARPTFLRLGRGTWSTAGDRDAWRGVQSQLPESWLAWDGVDVAVMADASAAEATSAQVEALRTWLRLGGTLVVTSGAQTNALINGPLADLLPMTVSGTEILPDLHALEPWAGQPLPAQSSMVATGMVKADAEVLLEQDGVPLVVSAPVDQGRIVMTTFDFVAEPVKYWDGQVGMWRHLLAGVEPRERWQTWPSASHALRPSTAPPGHPAADGELASATAANQASALPPLWLMIGFLGAYIVMLVPVNYAIVSRWLKRRELAWLTTPAIIALFVAAAYGTGFALRGHQTLLNRLALVTLEAGQSVAKGTGWVGLFSPAKTTYELRLEDDVGVTAAGVGGTDEFTVLGGPAPRIPDLAVNMWSTRVVEATFLADIGGPITGYLEYDGSGGAISAHIENNSELTLRRCGIIQGERVGRTVTVAPGSSADLSFIRPSDLSAVGGEEPTLADRGLQRLSSRGIRHAAGPMGYTYSARARVARVIAVCERQAVPITLDGPARTEDAMILLLDLPVRLKPATGMLVPQWLIDVRITGGGQGVSTYPGTAEVLQPGSPALFEFTVPSGPRGVKAVGLQFSASFSAMHGATGRPTVEVFNFDTGRWTTPVGHGTITIKPPEEHMSEDGRVLIRLSSPGTTFVVNPSLRARVDSF